MFNAHWRTPFIPPPPHGFIFTNELLLLPISEVWPLSSLMVYWTELFLWDGVYVPSFQAFGCSLESVDCFVSFSFLSFLAVNWVELKCILTTSGFVVFSAWTFVHLSQDLIVGGLRLLCHGLSGQKGIDTVYTQSRFFMSEDLDCLDWSCWWEKALELLGMAAGRERLLCLPVLVVWWSAAHWFNKLAPIQPDCLFVCVGQIID